MERMGNGGLHVPWMVLMDKTAAISSEHNYPTPHLSLAGLEGMTTKCQSSQPTSALCPEQRAGCLGPGEDIWESIQGLGE